VRRSRGLAAEWHASASALQSGTTHVHVDSSQPLPRRAPVGEDCWRRPAREVADGSAKVEKRYRQVCLPGCGLLHKLPGLCCKSR
jgi:hypothetical protein